MKFKSLALACSAALMGISAVAQAEFSGNVALTSDYVFRGFSQTSGDPAIQGGFDYAHESGFYAGVWASNVESDPSSAINYDGASVEIDTYLGWGGEFNGVSVDANLLRYNYPGTRFDDNNTNELTLGLGYDFEVASVSGSLSYSDDFFGVDDAMYWQLGAEAPVGPVTVAAHYGWTDIDDDTKGDDYEDYSLGISTEYAGFGFDVSYYGTSGVAGGCAGNTCDDRVAFTISKSL